MRAFRQPSGSCNASAFAIVTLLLMAAGARAESNAFGTEGQTMPFGAISVELELGAGAPATGGATGHDFSLQVSPSVLHFFARNFAWGISLDFRYGDYELEAWPFTVLEFGASAGLAVHVPFNDIAGFFPQLWLGGGYMRNELMAIDGLGRDFFDPSFTPALPEDAWTTEGPYLSAQLLLPIVFHVARATLISLGPSARLHFAIDRGERTLEFGVSAGVGRYF